MDYIIKVKISVKTLVPSKSFYFDKISNVKDTKAVVLPVKPNKT